MRYHSKHKQARRIFLNIARIVIALGNEKAHYRAGKPAYDMQNYRQRVCRIAREQKPRDMIRRHGRYRDKLEHI